MSRCGKVNYELFSCSTILTAEKKGKKFIVSNNYMQIKNVCRPKKLYEFLWKNERTNERMNEWMNESEICARKPGPIKWNLFSDTFMNYLVFIILQNKS